MSRNLSIYVPGDDGEVERIDRKVKDLGAYLKRVARNYPEGTVAIYFTGGGTHHYRKHVRGQFEFVRQTIGP